MLEFKLIHVSKSGPWSYATRHTVIIDGVGEAPKKACPEFQFLKQ